MKTVNFRFLIYPFLFLSMIIELFFGVGQSSYAQSVSFSWSQPVNLSNSGLSARPNLIIDGSGVFHSIWMDTVSGYYHRSSTDGVRWTNSLLVDFPFKKNENPPKFVIDPSGTLHAFWTDRENALSYSRVKIGDIRNAGAWKTIKLAESAMSFDVGVDSDGVLHLVYLRTISSSGFNSGVYYRRTRDGGQNWSDGTALYISQYYRTEVLKETNVKIAVATINNRNSIFITWDNRAIKRIFLIKSNNAGISWETAMEVEGPRQGSEEYPFNLQVIAQNQNVLLLWHSGNPEVATSRCNQYSRFSTDEGKTWGARQGMFNDRWTCPTENKYLMNSGSNLIIYSVLQGQMYLSAWNGVTWSTPQLQRDLALFNNSETFQKVSLGCFQSAMKRNGLFVTGCDIAGGGDIWFTSRTIETVDKWFVQSSWSNPSNIASGVDRIISPKIIGDLSGTIHFFWTHTDKINETAVNKLYYKNLSNERWSQISEIIKSPTGSIIEPKVFYDPRENYLNVIWQDSQDNLFYSSRANANDAVGPTSWTTPLVIPAKEKNIGSFDIKFQQNSRVLTLVYAVPVNESRGIYMMQSLDGGKKWSSSKQVFNAVREDFDKVGSPAVDVDDQGNLHVIWSKLSPVSQSTKGLFYSKSTDNGATWSDAVQIVQSNIFETKIITSGSSLVVFWQFAGADSISTWYQFSLDGGGTWKHPEELADTKDPSGPLVVSGNSPQQPHLYRIVSANQGVSKSLEQWFLLRNKWLIQEDIVLTNDPKISIDDLEIHESPRGFIAAVFSSINNQSSQNPDYSLNFTSMTINQVSLPTNQVLPTAIGTSQTQATLTPTVGVTVTLAPKPTSSITATTAGRNPAVTSSSQTWIAPVVGIGSILIAIGLMLGVYIIRKRKTF